MKKTQVTSIEQLDKMLEQEQTDFVIASGILRSSKHITSDGEKYYVLHLIDDTEEELSAEELMESNIGAAMRNGNFYCEEY